MTLEVKDGKPDAEKIKEVEAECNDCAWEGRLEDMNMDDLDGALVYLCPKCNSENIYYF